MYYAKIDQQDLINDRYRLMEEWYPNFPFSNLTQHVKKIQEIDVDANRPIYDQKIINAVYTVLFNAILFYINCGEWNDQKMWTTFQAHFIK